MVLEYLVQLGAVQAVATTVVVIDIVTNDLRTSFELITKLKAVFYPFQDVIIDKAMIEWNSRQKYKQLNAAKPKTSDLCSSTTWYVCNIMTYFGSETTFKYLLRLEAVHAGANCCCD